MNRYFQVFLSVLAVSTGAAEAAGKSDRCREAYEDSVASIGRMLVPARWTSVNGGAGLVVTQSAMLATGTATTAGLVSGGGALVGAVGSYAYLSERHRSLERVLDAYRAAADRRYDDLEFVRAALERRRGTTMSLEEMAGRIVEGMETEALCRARQGRKAKPRGFGFLLRYLSRTDEA